MSASQSDSVFIRGIEFEANHGYSAAERRATRRFRVNVALGASLARAALSDRLGDTIDYFKVSQAVVSVGTNTTFRLLEALAGSMASAIHAIYPGAELTIELEKLAPPCPGVPQACGVRLHFPARESA